MTTSFQDRIDRIAPKHADPVDLIGQGNRHDMAPMPAPPVKPHRTFAQRYNTKIMINGVIGFVWMFLTITGLLHYGAAADFIETRPLFGDAVDTYKTSYLCLLLFSVFVFIGPTLFSLYAFFADNMLVNAGFLPLAVKVGCILGIIVALGPIDVAKFFLHFTP